MEWIFFGVFSVFAAILFNFIQPKLQATAIGQKAGAAGYVGNTLITAAGFFIVLALAGFLMSIVVGKKAAEVPTA